MSLPTSFTLRFANDAPASLYHSTQDLVLYVEGTIMFVDPKATLDYRDADGEAKELGDEVAMGDEIELSWIDKTTDPSTDEVIDRWNSDVYYYAPRGWISLNEYHAWHDHQAAREERARARMARRAVMRKEDEAARQMFKLEAVAHTTQKVA